MDNLKKEHIKRLEVMEDAPSTWREEAAFRINNHDWLRKSKRIATAMLIQMDSMGLNQDDLAKKMGVKQQYISKLLSGNQNFTLTTIVKIEEALNMTILSVSTCN